MDSKNIARRFNEIHVPCPREPRSSEDQESTVGKGLSLSSSMETDSGHCSDDDTVYVRSPSSRTVFGSDDVDEIFQRTADENVTLPPDTSSQINISESHNNIHVGTQYQLHITPNLIRVLHPGEIVEIEFPQDNVKMKISITGLNQTTRDAMDEQMMANLSDQSIFARLYDAVKRWSSGLLSVFYVRRACIEIVLASHDKDAAETFRNKIRDGSLEEEIRRLLLTENVVSIANGESFGLNIELVDDTANDNDKPIQKKEVIELLATLCKEERMLVSEPVSIRESLVSGGSAMAGAARECANVIGGGEQDIDRVMEVAKKAYKEHLIKQGFVVRENDGGTIRLPIMAGACAVVGGLTFGSSGMSVGKIVGSVAAQVTPIRVQQVADIIHDLSSDTKEVLYNRVKPIIVDLSRSGNAGNMRRNLLTDSLSKKELLSAVEIFFEKDLRMELVDFEIFA